MAPNRTALTAGRVLLAVLAVTVFVLEFSRDRANRRAPPPPAVPAADRARARYSPEEILFFQEMAFGRQYGVASRSIQRWIRDIRVGWKGSPTGEDLAALDSAVRELDALLGGLRVSPGDEESDLVVIFAPRAELPRYLAEYVPGNDAFFWSWTEGGGEITRAVVLLATDTMDQEVRSRRLRHYLARSVGLQGASSRHPESVFHEGEGGGEGYAAIDRTMLEMLYRPELQPGMTAERAVTTLRGI